MAWLIFRAAKRVSDLEERQEKLERDLRAALLDAEDLWEKARRALGRVSKRAGVLEPEEQGRPSHIDPVSWRIIQRRKPTVRPGGGNGG